MSVMKLTPEQLARFEAFLDAIKGQTYPERPSEPHGTITRRMIDSLFARLPAPPGAAVLDVGCGQGLSLSLFKARGFNPIGIAIVRNALSSGPFTGEPSPLFAGNI